jgi:predicted acetyltransferase
MDLRLRPPELRDERACVAAQAEFGTYPFLLFWREETPWPDYVRLLQGLQDGSAVPVGFVRSAFLLAEAGGELVGRVSVRFELNSHLAQDGGHIGYAVRQGFRRRGYATEILHQAVAVARAEGVEHLLVVCDDGNVASARAIEHCGGTLESIVVPDEGGTPFRRYWIDSAGPAARRPNATSP